MSGTEETRDADARAERIRLRVQQDIAQYGDQQPEDLRASSSRFHRLRDVLYTGAGLSWAVVIGSSVIDIAERSIGLAIDSVLATCVGALSLGGAIAVRMKSDQFSEAAQVLEAARAAQQLNDGPLDSDVERELAARVPESLRERYLIDPPAQQVFPPSAR
jgi:hypothetical protein